MKKLIALLLIALVVLASGCTTFTSSPTMRGPDTATANPIAEAFGGASNPDAGSPPPMPQLPG